MHISLDSALGQPHRRTQTGESVLQIAPNAAAAYSLRSLTGGDPRAVRVRRDTGGAAGDNDEEDFTTSEISSGALTAFVGSGNDGFVSIWYDQSGSDNATQSTPGSQAKIVNSGTLLEDANGNPYLDLDGTDDFFSATKTIFNDVSYGYASTVAQYDNTTAKNTPIYYASTGTSGTSTRALLGKISSGGGEFAAAGRRTDTDAFRSSIETVDANKNILTGLFQWNDGSMQLFVNGAAKTAGNFAAGAGNTSATDSNSAFLGRLGPHYFDGKMYEIIVYNTDQSGNREAIETNMANKYGITLS
jgi:hypothetical protein